MPCFLFSTADGRQLGIAENYFYAVMAVRQDDLYPVSVHPRPGAAHARRGSYPLVFAHTQEFSRRSKASVQGICRKISERTGRRQERKAPDQLVGELNRMISGWAQYFRLG